MSASAAAISGRRPATGRGMRRAILALALFAALALAAGFWIDLADRRLAAAHALSVATFEADLGEGCVTRAEVAAAADRAGFATEETAPDALTEPPAETLDWLAVTITPTGVTKDARTLYAFDADGCRTGWSW